MARCIALGADDFLHKPVDPWLLKARVDASLLRKQQRDAQGGAPGQAGAARGHETQRGERDAGELVVAQHLVFAAVAAFPGQHEPRDRGGAGADD